MNHVYSKTIARLLIFCLCLLPAGLSRGALTELYFRAGVTTNTMTDGRQVVMWGFAQDSGPATLDGVITVPGPTIALPDGSQDLLIHLTNTLPEPVSIVIPGQPAAMGDPQRNPDGRVRSFTHEAVPGDSADYSWQSLRPGTHLYYSGSHSALQVQMGLYGPLSKLAGVGQAYPGIPFDSEVTFLFSEIDPDLHDAVASDNYGPGKSVTSTLNYYPRYFFINGVSYTNGLPPVYAGKAGSRILLRLLNAGIDYHVPTLNNMNFQLVAEDGFPLPFPRESYAEIMSPLKTFDTVMVDAVSNIYAVYDRRLGLFSATNSPGGMLTYLHVFSPPHVIGDPFVDITNPAPQSVFSPVVNIYGTNNMDTAGLWVSNATVGGVSSPFAWGDAVTIVPGLNSVFVYGSNIFGAVANDSHDVTYYAPAFIDITNPAPQAVSSPSVNIYGTNSIYTVGGLWVSNAAAGGAASSFTWGDAVALVPGLNTVFVFGSNSYGTVASDSHQVSYYQSPFVDITTPDFSVPYAVSSTQINGTSVYCVGSITYDCYSNSLAGILLDSGSLPATSAWQFTVNNLAYGLNIVAVNGTNALGDQSLDTVFITRQPTAPSASDVERLTISLSGSTASLSWSNGFVSVIACTNRYFSTNSLDWFVMAQDVLSPWTDVNALTYPSIYYRVASGTYTSLYAVGAYTIPIKQSDGVLFHENWVSSPFEFLDANGNVTLSKSFDELQVAAALTDQSGLLNNRDLIQSQEPIGGDTFTASRGNGIWYAGNASATNWYANKMYLILINPLHTGPDKLLTFFGKVRTAAATLIGGIVQSDGVLIHENWVAYPYPSRSSFDQGAVSTVLTDQSGLLYNRDLVQSQEPIGGDTFTASRGVGTWFSSSPAATNLFAGKGYIIYINPLHTGATTNWYVPKPY